MEARDDRLPYKTSETPATVTITVNRTGQIPEFEEERYEATVHEHKPVNFPVITVPVKGTVRIWTYNRTMKHSVIFVYEILSNI